MPVYDKVGSSVYPRESWYVEDGGSAYPVRQAYVKVGSSLYKYYDSGLFLTVFRDYDVDAGLLRAYDSSGNENEDYRRVLFSSDASEVNAFVTVGNEKIYLISTTGTTSGTYRNFPVSVFDTDLNPLSDEDFIVTAHDRVQSRGQRFAVNSTHMFVISGGRGSELAKNYRLLGVYWLSLIHI